MAEITNKVKRVRLGFPFKGQHSQAPFTDQPKDTSPAMSNLFPFDWRANRRRGAQRPGTNRAHGNALPLGSPLHANGMWTAQATDGTYNITITAGGNIYQAGGTLAALVITTAGVGQLTAAQTQGPAITDIFGIMYFADGVNGIKKLTLTTATSATHTATVGSLPTNPTILVNFRSRLVCSGCASDPQNIFMSRAGSPGDFDYGKLDALAAVALNASTSAGRIGQRVISLMPFATDQLLIGCERSLFVMKGDPADGGSVLTVSDGVGMHTRDSWCVDPSGNVYFLGTNGFFRYSRDGELKSLSAGRLDDFMSQWPRTYRVTMAWDRQRNGCYLFAAPYTSGAGAGFYYDANEDAFFPITLPAGHGPMSCCVFDPIDGGTNRNVLLGGRDGFIRKLDAAATNDDGTAISSSVKFGPMMPAASGQSKMTEAEFFLGNNGNGLGTFNVDWRVEAGRDATTVDASPLHLSGGSFTREGRQLPRRQRATGAWFVLVLSNSTNNAFWNLEEAAFTYEAAEN
jgi:hypothetical protein